MNRRNFLVLSAATMLAAQNSLARVPADRKRKVKVAASPQAWGVWFPESPMQVPWERFLDEAEEAGFEWIELGPYGYLPTEPTKLKDALAERNLKLCGGTFRAPLWDETVWRAQEVLALKVWELLAAMEADYCALSCDTYYSLFSFGPNGPRALEGAAWKKFTETIAVAARTAKGRFGLKLAVHPQIETPIENEAQIEALLEAIESGLISLCLDVGAMAFSGADCADFMNRLHDRIACVRIKDLNPEIEEVVKAENMNFARAMHGGLFCPPGAGRIDFGPIFAAMRDVEFGGSVVVDQELYTVAYDKPLSNVRSAREFLRKAGMS